MTISLYRIVYVTWLLQGWNSLRSAYSGNMYNTVEKDLAPTFQCPPRRDVYFSHNHLPRFH